MDNLSHSGNSVVQYVESVLGDYKTTRKPLEDKWNRNYAAYRRDRTLIGAHKKENPAATADGTNDKAMQVSFDVTTQKVVAACSIIGDVYFKGGRLPFVLSDESLPSEVQSEIEGLPEGDSRRVVLENRLQSIEENEQLIHRQNEQSNAAEVMETVVLAGAVYGQMFVKWYLKPVEQTSFMPLMPNDWSGPALPVTNRISVPAVAYKTPWCLYYDWSVGIRDSEHVIEVDEITPLDAYRMIDGVGGSVKSAILEVLKNCVTNERSNASNDESAPPIAREMSRRNQTLERRQWWGYIDARDVEQAVADLYGSDFTPTAVDQYRPPVYVHAIILAGRLVKLVQTSPEEMPYYDAAWQVVLDGMGGVSVADNVEDQQKVLDKFVDSLVEASDYLSKFILAGKRRLINGDFTKLQHGLFLDLDEEATSVKDAVHQLVFKDNTGPIMKIVETFITFADYSANIPRAEQGQQSENAQTAFELKSRLERSGKYLGSVIRRIDELVEKLINRHYSWNQMDPENRIARGNYRVRAVGFSSFENKWDRIQRLLNLLMLILQNDDLKAMSKIRYLYEEIIKGADVDPDQVIKTSAELLAEADRREAQLQASEAAMREGGGGNAAELQAVELQRAQIERLRAEAQKKLVEAEELRSAGVIKRAEAAAKLQQSPMAGQ